MARVRIGTCSGPAEAALVRAAFEAHDIRVVINAEQHASMLGGLGGALVPLHILVDDSDAEEATALLADLRANAVEPEFPDDDGDEDEESAGASGVEARVDSRRRTGVVMLLALCLTFGTAHMYMRAWARGFGLLALEIVAFRYVVVDPHVGSPLLVGCIAADLVGALLILRGSRARLPNARVRR